MTQENNQNNIWMQNDLIQQKSQQISMQDNFNSNDLANNTNIKNNKLPFEKLPDLLNEENRKLINALASVQLDYGHANEAIALLLLCRLNAPDDLQTLRLLIQAYLFNEWWDQAEQTNEEFKYYSQKKNSFFYLFSALSLLGKKKLNEARSQFKIFYQNKLRTSN